MVLPAWVVSLLLLAGCAPATRDVRLRFEPSDAASVQQLQFYVHDVFLLDENGRAHPMEIEDQAPWQSTRLALLDLAAGQAGPRRNAIEGKARGQRYTGVRFIVGVPFALNHLDQLTAAPPLDRPDMFWSWQTGYKFLRIDLSAQEHELAFHLGSTGCSSASALRPPQQPCAQPNLIRIELRGFDPTSRAIEVRTDEIVGVLANAQQRACTGDYASPACAAAFKVTGLDIESGECAATAGGEARPATVGDDASVCTLQRLFTVR